MRIQSCTLPSVFSPWGVLYMRSMSPVVPLQWGHPTNILLPCGASPFRLSPAHSLLFILHPPPGAPVSRTSAAVLTAPWTISHNWHHAIITSNQSNLWLPLLLPSSCPTRPTLSHICHKKTQTHKVTETYSNDKAGFWITVVLKTAVAQQWA